MSAVVVRRGTVCRWDDGPRTFTAPPGPRGAVLRAARPLTSLACVRSTERVLALTFDDGPDPEHTPQVLDVLAAHRAQATFFVLVERARAHPELVQRMVVEGHEVALHGQDHSRLSTLPAREAVRRVAAARTELATLVGRPVRLYRPAYGAQSLGQLVGTRMLGLDVVLWSAWCRDWQNDAADEVLARARDAVHPGAILLLHDGCGDPALGSPSFSRAAVVDALLAHLRQGAWQVVTVSGLLRGREPVRTLWAEREAQVGAP